MSAHRLGFRSLSEEVGPVDLPITGKLPHWLDGALLRTGPALFEVENSRYRHWFDGLAMLYRFAFQDGRVRYSNRFLRSRGFEAARAQGRIVYGEFGSVPAIGILGRIGRLIRDSETSDNANVNVVCRYDGVFALTETPTPMQFDPDTLETIGSKPFRDGFEGQVTTAHPHTDAKRKVQVNYLLAFGRRSAIHVLEAPLDGCERRMVASVPVDQPCYMHSFGMTDRHVVLVEPPYRVSPLRLRFSLQPFIASYRWHAGEGTRFRLVDRTDGSVVTLEGDPCFAFHQTNAFDDGDAVVIDLCAYPDAAIVDGLGLERLRGPGTAGLTSSRLLRYRLPKSGGTAKVEEAFSEAVELPRINEGMVAGRRYRSMWAASIRGADSGFLDRIVRIDVEDGSRTAVWEREDCFAGEPLFVPHPESNREAEGLILSVILDGAREKSALLVLDAETLEEVGRADLPHIVPFHFHGRHVKGPELQDTTM
jgi:carotenoid cleavage dioxygenase-like enzyme